MSNQNNKNGLNDFEKQLEDINEYQKNVTNPGYYVGSGKVPVPLRNTFKSPVVMLIVGILFAIPTILNLVGDFSIGTIFSDVMVIAISVGLIFGGTIRILKRNQ